MRTAREAVAWTFDLNQDDYAPTVETWRWHKPELDPHFRGTANCGVARTFPFGRWYGPGKASTPTL